MQPAQLTNAVLLLPSQNRARFGFTPISDGEQIRLGDTTLRALHTPGHTTASTSYLVNQPPNFGRIVDLNETGDFPDSDPTELEAGANRCAVR